MANQNFTKLSVSLLPVEDIQELMRYQYDFITKADKATDTLNVSGTPGENIAIAVSPAERNTVQNALQLGGVDAEGYMTVAKGGDLTQGYDNVKKIYAKEVRDLRDELYQLKAELGKRGLVTNFNHYGGFSDVFQNGDIVYENMPITTIMKDSTAKNEIAVDEIVYSSLDVGDYIVIEQEDTGRSHVAVILEKEADGETIRFDPQTLHDIKANHTKIYSSLGMYENGSYTFSKVSKQLPTAKTMYSVLNDDTNRHRKNLTAPNTGFAYTFRIPDSMFAVNGESKTTGYLVGLQAKVTKVGTPGPLTAYVIDEKDIKSFKNPRQAEADGILVAKSAPVIPERATEEAIVNFNFFDGDTYPILNNRDFLDEKTRFCMIIEATGAIDASNYYRVMFLQHKNSTTGELGDLQLNNVLHNYTRQENTSLEGAIITSADINTADLYYGVETRGVINNGMVSFREGVYTAKIDLPGTQDASRARLTLRVNREGLYETDNAPGESIRDGNRLMIKKNKDKAAHYDMHELGGIGAKNNEDFVVIGSEIRKLVGQSAEAIQLKNGMYLEKTGVPVYRVGYKVYLKAIQKEYNTSLHKYEEKKRVKIELPLSTVMPDRVRKSENISDRLIFENEFPNLEKFNEFELQVYWRTEYSAQFDSDNYKNDFRGRIHDLSLSFDRAL